MLKLLLARLRNRWVRNRLRGKELPDLADSNLAALDHLDLNEKAKEKRYVFFDLETTGLNRYRDKVISISAVRMVEGRILIGDVFSSLVNPDRNIPSSAVKIHGIVPSMVARAPSVDQILDRFLGYLQTDILVGYHTRFDLNFLNKTMKRQYGFRLQNLVLDVMFMCRKTIWPAHIRKQAIRLKADQGLDTMASFFGIDIPERHTAMGDALATAMIFQRILAELEKRGSANLRNLLSI